MSKATNQEFNALLNSSIEAIESARCLSPKVVAAAQMMVDCFKQGGKILICGNGGSAADSLHFSSELLNKFDRIRRPLPGISLVADASTLTSIGNDESFDVVFSKQVEALGHERDILVPITTSGNSPSVLKATEAALKIGMRVITLNGRDGGKLSGLVNDGNIDIVIPQEKTAR
ncbi:MAG: D-sedoheptulose-7-phosphate isomerase, partial [bacterium]